MCCLFSSAYVRVGFARSQHLCARLSSLEARAVAFEVHVLVVLGVWGGEKICMAFVFSYSWRLL